MQDKVILITGGTSGIGRACVEKFGDEGAKVAFTGRNEEKLQEVAQILNEKGISNLPLQADVSKEDDNQYVIDRVVQQFGQLDILINNAGIAQRALFESLNLDVFKEVMDINFYGTLYATKYALPHIKASGGAIVGVSSINGFRGTPARTAYTASKFAMNGFFEALRMEVMHEGIHVMVVCPGFTTSNIRKTALTADGKPQGKSPWEEEKGMPAEEVAEAIFRGLRKKKRDIVLTREGKLAHFLNKWIPGNLDKIIYRKMAKETDSPLK